MAAEDQRISAETVQQLCDLAELELAPDEADRMRRDLDAVLGYVEKLSELDTAGVPPTAYVHDVATPMRVDRVGRVLDVDEALRNAPEHDERSMVVPKVVE